jgi:chromosome segregation ATPase
MHKHLMIVTVSALMAGAACAESQADQVKDARMEQAEARAKTNEENVEQASKAREKSIDGAYDARDESIGQANRPDENATQTLNGISKDRAQYQSQAKTRLDKLGVRINEAAQKIEVLGSRAPTNLRTELQTATTEHNLLKNDIDTLNNTRTTDWESLKSEIDNRLSGLDTRLKNLNDKIVDV